MLCDLCKRFCVSVLTGDLHGEEWHQSTLSPSWRNFNFPDLAAVRDRALSGQCGFCTLIYAADEDVPQRGILAPHGRRTLLGSEITASVCLTHGNMGRRPWTFCFEKTRSELEFCFLNPATKYPQIEITPLDITIPAQVESQIGTAVNNFSGSDSVFALAKRWISNCLLNHTGCADRGSKKALPRRVIDVGEMNSEKSWSSPRIIESGGRKGHYMTLSYRWSTLDSQFCTTRENLAQLMQCLPLWKLPRTIQDAITFCRALGYRHLWVDSLCIIQGDDEDWQEACNDMANIFENSHVGISALQSQDSHAGLFNYRFYRDFSNQICLRLSDGRLLTVRSTEFERELPRETAESNMDSRGWILQERLLSPAIVHFGRHGIYWECKNHTISEAFSNSESQVEGVLKNILMDIQRPGCINHPGGHFIAWYLIIMHYSYKRLSFESDRMSAILGLAARFQEKFGTTFVAGIWREDLHRGLLWNVSPWARYAPDSVVNSPRPAYEGINPFSEGQTVRVTGSSAILDDRQCTLEHLSGPSWSWLNTIETNVIRYEVEQHLGSDFEMHPISRIDSSTDAIFVDINVKPCPRIHRGAVRGEIKLWGTVVPAEATAFELPVDAKPIHNRFLKHQFNLRRKPRSPVKISRPSPSRCKAKVERHHLVSKVEKPAEGPSLPFTLDNTFLARRDCWCLVIADWRFESSLKGFFNISDEVAYRDELRCYLILQRVRPPAKNSNVVDLGVFKRIGVGGAKVAEVEHFFGASGAQKKFLTLV